MKNLRCFLLFACLLIAVPAHAQYDFTILGAAHHPGKLTLRSAATTGTTASNFNPATFGAIGVRFGRAKVWGHEQTIIYAPNFLEADTKAVILNGNFILQGPLPKAKPYATAGMGTIISFGTDASGRPSLGKIGTKFALNYGGGVKVLPAGPVGVRFDIRGYLVPSVKFNMPTLQNQTIRTESQNLNILEVGAGIVFSFGRN